MLRWLWGAVAQWSEHLQLKQEALGSIPSGYPGFFFFSSSMAPAYYCRWGEDLWYSSTVRLLSTQEWMGWRDALVQFGCYQHRYEWKGLWCSSTVQLLSTQTWVNTKAPSIIRLSLKLSCSKPVHSKVTLPQKFSLIFPWSCFMRIPYNGEVAGVEMNHLITRQLQPNTHTTLTYTCTWLHFQNAETCDDAMDLRCLEACVDSNFNEAVCRSCEATRPILPITVGSRDGLSLNNFLVEQANSDRLSGITCTCTYTYCNYTCSSRKFMLV